MNPRLTLIQCQVHNVVLLANGQAPGPTCYLHHDGTWHCLHCHRGGFWKPIAEGRYLLHVTDTMPVKFEEAPA